MPTAYATLAGLETLTPPLGDADAFARVLAHAEREVALLILGPTLPLPHGLYADPVFAEARAR